MIRDLIQRWQDWTGDKQLERAIRAELRRLGYAVNPAPIRRVRLVAIERPGWVQVYQFVVETVAGRDGSVAERRRVELYGVARDDGRKSGIDVLLTEDSAAMRERLDAWAEGLIRR